MDLLIEDGPVYSVVTPFSKHGEIDYSSLSNYLGSLISAGARTLYLMAYNSRFSQLRRSEIMELTAFTVGEVKSIDPSVKVIAGGPIACSTNEDLEYIQYTAQIGADCYSALFNERYYASQQVVVHYRNLASASNLPILVHQMNLVSGRDGSLMPWPLEALEGVMSLDGVAAMKEDSKNAQLTKEVLNSFADNRAIILSGGGKRQFLSHIQDGASFWLNGVGVFFPNVPQRFWAALNDEDLTTVQLIVDEIEEPFFSRFVSRFGWHTSMRAAIEAAGYFQRWERSPMYSLDSVDYAEISDWVHQVLNTHPDLVGRRHETL